MLKLIHLTLRVCPTHFSNAHLQVSGCNLCVSTSHTFQYSIMDESELFLELNRPQ